MIVKGCLLYLILMNAQNSSYFNSCLVRYVYNLGESNKDYYKYI